MKIFQNSKVLLFCIVLLAALMRFWGISDNPPSLYWDEVSQGYNSYSILKTGYDEHHELFPVTRFIAFGDYKAPVYIYLDVPFIAAFGKSALAVRFPSALFGSLTILLCYLLVNELFYKNKNREKISIFAALLLSISPWHIQLSRAAYEANIATFFTVLAIVLFYFAKRQRSFFFIFSSVSFVVAFYSFNAHRVFIPLLVIFLSALYTKTLLQYKKELIISFLLSFLLMCPFLKYLTTSESRLRYNEVNIFSDLGVIKQSNTYSMQEKDSIGAKIFNNRRLLFSLLYIKHYFDFFNPDYLFIHGDGNPRFSLQDNGELFFWELPFILIGFYLLLKERSKESLFILGWFLLAPIAAATARETPHALRSETYIPTYEIIAGGGLYCVMSFIRKRREIVSKSFYGLFLFAVLGSLIIFIHDYTVHYPPTYDGVWQYGYKQAVQQAESLKNNYDYILFTNKYGRAYIYVLFFAGYSPQDYWKYGVAIRDPFGFYNVSQFGKYIFSYSFKDKRFKDKRILLITTPDDIPSNFKVFSTIKFLEGTTAFVFAKN